MRRQTARIFAIIIALIFLLSTLASILVIWADEENPNVLPEDNWQTITISAAGDVTLGRDESFSYYNSFDHEFEVQKRNYSYFMKNVKDIFANDDLTLINLEAPFTTATEKAVKTFRFKANPAYTEILKQGSIEAVNLANNHTFDYLQKGYRDTVITLSKAGLGYFGFDNSCIKEIKGIKVGMIGFTGWDNSKQKKAEIKKSVDQLKAQDVKLIIASFHWGEERKNYPNSIQKDLGRYCIDIGVDLVLGHHPHVVQGVETYKGKSIVYSLGNFCFGGNKNPTDKDAFIYQHSFRFKNNVLEAQEPQIIPISVSSVSNRNNYQPTPLQGAEAARVMNRIKLYSANLSKK